MESERIDLSNGVLGVGYGDFTSQVMIASGPVVFALSVDEAVQLRDAIGRAIVAGVSAQHSDRDELMPAQDVSA